MSDSPPVGARRFEAYARWSTYFAVSVPAGTLARSAVEADRLTGVPLVALVTAGVLALALVIGNVLITNWSVAAVVGRPRRLSPGGVLTWALVLVALIAVTFAIPLPAMGLTVAAVIGSSAASFTPVLDARRTLLLNTALVVLAAPLVGVTDIALLLVGAALISGSLWLCWSSAWMLRVLLELQSVHETRAALALANERLRISRDLHDVFGRTLATISVKSSLASELVRRGHDDRAAAEITEVRRLAEEAGTEVRHVVRGELRMSWDGEVSGARSLLGSAGIRCTVTGDPVPPQCAEALAWVVREGVTNLLRHSAATRVTLATTRGDGQVQLTIANDGAGPALPGTIGATDRAAGADTGGGTGLPAMSERISALGGHVATRRDGDWFLLDATIPLEEVPA